MKKKFSSSASIQKQSTLTEKEQGEKEEEIKCLTKK
jgi:hypothetical protein